MVFLNAAGLTAGFTVVTGFFVVVVFFTVVVFFAVDCASAAKVQQGNNRVMSIRFMVFILVERYKVSLKKISTSVWGAYFIYF
ncbi:hypothetical protein PBAL39_08741 [Pedobacter sp. BAL39]|nr:hypothetical protein PBAL39_08741 [Pedobacter sp. BAL39]